MTNIGLIIFRIKCFASRWSFSTLKRETVVHCVAKRRLLLTLRIRRYTRLEEADLIGSEELHSTSSLTCERQKMTRCEGNFVTDGIHSLIETLLTLWRCSADTVGSITSQKVSQITVWCVLHRYTQRSVTPCNQHTLTSRVIISIHSF